MSDDCSIIETFIDQKRKENPEVVENIENKKQRTMETKIYRKLKKSIMKAIHLKMAYEVIDDQVIVHPKVILKQVKDYASMKDIRRLLFALFKMNKPTPFAELPEFSGVQPVGKVIFIDAPILDPHELGLPLEVPWVSKSDTPEVYNKIVSSSIRDYINVEDDVIGLVTVVGFDQYKRVGDRFMDLLEVPLTKADVKKRREEEEKLPDGTLAIPPEMLVMTLEELKMEDFPIHSSLDSNSVLEDGWVETSPGKGAKVKRLVALDCEMCKTVNGYAITRVALIDREHTILINEFVKPTEEVTDYITHISGVSEQSLVGVNTTLADIQKKLLALIDGDTILVGHGLVNDLRCLRMKHPYIIDTSIIYHHKNGPPYKASLKDLVAKYLKRSIQVESVDGHDPCEDAIASLELVERKLQRGINYGLTGLSQVKTILDNLNSQKQEAAVIETNANLSVSMNRMLSEHLLKGYFPEANDEHVCKKLIELHPSKKFIFARLDLPQETEQDRQSTFHALFSNVYKHAEPYTVFCLSTGYRKNKQREELREKRLQYKKNLKKIGLEDIPMEERWSPEEELLLEQTSDSTRRGFVFIHVKGTDK